VALSSRHSELKSTQNDTGVTLAQQARPEMFGRKRVWSEMMRPKPVLDPEMHAGVNSAAFAA